MIRFVDFSICRYNSAKTPNHYEINGVADSIGGENVLVSLQSDNVQRTLCHELSHLVGAEDYVCTSGEDCVMTYGSLVTNVWCTQCTSDIDNYLN